VVVEKRSFGVVDGGRRRKREDKKKGNCVAVLHCCTVRYAFPEHGITLVSQHLLAKEAMQIELLKEAKRGSPSRRNITCLD